MTKLEYRIIKTDNSVLRQLGIEWWNLCTIDNGMMYFSRPIEQVGWNYSKPVEVS